MGIALFLLERTWSFACDYWGSCSDAIQNTVNFWLR